NARKVKTVQHAIKTFEKGVDGNLLKIQKILLDKTFLTSPYKVKTIYEPKQREIYILPFAPDRIVHHAVMNIVEPIWERLFISDSYACRKGKGIHAGSEKTMEFVRKNNYCLKCDISKFYPSVQQDILYEIITRKIKCKDTLWLMKDIIYSIGGGKNVPIGNYTSQWFGNLYLNELDQFIKHRYKVKHYIRYCDDFLLFHNDKKFIYELAHKIKEFLETKLKLTLSKCDLFPVSRGVDFLGYRHFRDYILLRKSTAKRIEKRLRQLPKLFKTSRITIDQFQSSIASIEGWLKWANTYNLSISLQINKLVQIYAGAEKI
ncbi:MAG TPA: RNA-directed DNA polymerase, partial [Candidatus Wunengus sp. YC60]|uniref:RNA-directed DNA polymerase n=1 Tax=Candidatus Wunengus sp. YC60 TaxID=3367697 RepID=UPI00402927B1